MTLSNGEEYIADHTSPSGSILVTGGAGLVGNELLHQLLDKDYHVKATWHNTPLKITHENLTAIKCDILDVDVLAGIMQEVNTVFHCAAVVSFNDDDDNIASININGTANIVNTAIDANVSKLVYVSSVATLGKPINGKLINEDFEPDNETASSHYSQSKWWAEMEVWRGTGEGLDAIIVNPSIILGGDDWTRGSTKIFKTAWEEFPWYTEGITGFVDVRDVAKAMIQLWEQGVTNQRFILSAENKSYKDIFTSIATTFSKKPPSKKVSTFLAGLIWRVEKARQFFTNHQPLLNRHTANTALTKKYFDNTKVKNTLSGFVFRPISETIADTCKVLSGVYHL
jgi:nucleoside-diphosphate-sugar epimerase